MQQVENTPPIPSKKLLIKRANEKARNKKLPNLIPDQGRIANIQRLGELQAQC